MSQINDLSNAYVADFARLSPIAATFVGIGGPQDSLDDLSPAGLAELQALRTSTLQAVRAAESAGPGDEIAREVIIERLEVQSDNYESGWEHAKLAVIASPVQMLIMLFDLMPTATDNDWSTIARRMQAVPDALAGYRASLDHAATAGQVVAARQIRKAAEQAQGLRRVRLGTRVLLSPGDRRRTERRPRREPGRRCDGRRGRVCRSRGLSGDGAAAAGPGKGPGRPRAVCAVLP